MANKMRKVLLLVVLSIICSATFAQGYLSFYQLRDIVPQTQNLQPAFIPDNTFSISLIPTVGVNVQGDWALEDILSRPPGQDELTVDFNVLSAATNASDFLSIDATVNVFHLGYKTKVGAFSLFSNVKSNLDFKYNEDLIDFLANGNGDFVGETIDFSGNSLKYEAFQEIGLGYANTYLNNRLTAGVRMKLVTGMFHASIQEGASATLATDVNDFTWTVNMQNATVNTAGLDYLFNSDDYADGDLTSYLTNNQNSTVAFDLGAKFKIKEWLEVEAAINDIGSITWKEQARNYNIYDTTAVFSGVELRGIEDSDQVFEDSLTAKFRSDETRRAFKSNLPTRIFLTASYYLTANDRFSVTYFKRAALEGMPANMAFSFNHRFEKFVVGVQALYRGSNNEINFGANVGTNFGPVQLFAATDNFLILNKPETYSKADFRVGLNLLFGYKKWKKKDDIVDLDKL